MTCEVDNNLQELNDDPANQTIVIAFLKQKKKDADETGGTGLGQGSVLKMLSPIPYSSRDRGLKITAISKLPDRRIGRQLK